MSSENSTKVRNSDFVGRFIEIMGTDEPAIIQRKLGIDYQSAKNYLGGRKPKAEVLELIAHKTGVSLNWLLTGKGKKTVIDLISDAEIEAIEKLRKSWNEDKKDEQSFQEFLRTLLLWGRVSVKSDENREKIRSQFESLEFVVNRDFLLSQSIIEIIRQEINDGSLRESIIDLVQEEFFDEKEEISEDERNDLIRRLKTTYVEDLGKSSDVPKTQGEADKTIKKQRKKKA